MQQHNSKRSIYILKKLWIQNITFTENYDMYGIHIKISNNNIIESNTIYNRSCGICLDAIFPGSSKNNTISQNILLNNYIGIDFLWSDYNTITNNIISLNRDYAIKLHNSFYNNITQNILLTNSAGIFIEGLSNENTITNNIIALNKDGISLLDSYRNVIYHNNIKNNKNQANDNKPAKNYWYHPKLLEGNYWSDYTGSDDGSGIVKHDFSGDHIGDTLIPHPSVFYDGYPYVYETGWKRPSIVIHQNNKTYSDGDTMIVSLNLINPDGAMAFAIGIWVDLPSGSKYFVYENSSTTLPAGFDYRNPTWLTITLPSIPPGNYAWHAILIDEANSEIVSESIEPWLFSGAVDGISESEFEKVLQEVSEEIDFFK
ncbi:MAG: nitrous oxide reductase family maturation protein NosD [Methanosarcinales archaeon]